MENEREQRLYESAQNDARILSIVILWLLFVAGVYNGVEFARHWVVDGFTDHAVSHGLESLINLAMMLVVKDATIVYVLRPLDRAMNWITGGK